MADWWYTKNGERQGPVSSSQLRQLAQAGELLPTDMVFKEGGTEWKLASTVSNLFPSGGGSSGVQRERERDRDRDRDRDRGGREERDGGGMDFDDQDDEDRPSRRRGTGSSGTLMDLLMFRRMIAPIIIMVLFWLGIVGAVGYGLFGAGTAIYLGGARGVLFAAIPLLTIPVVVLAVRLYAELAILLFRIHETLTDIKKLLEKDQRPKN
jgi:hypothetical protein